MPLGDDDNEKISVASQSMNKGKEGPVDLPILSKGLLDFIEVSEV